MKVSDRAHLRNSLRVHILFEEELRYFLVYIIIYNNRLIDQTMTNNCFLVYGLIVKYITNCPRSHVLLLDMA